jgi:hypothetical protein
VVLSPASRRSPLTVDLRLCISSPFPSAGREYRRHRRRLGVCLCSFCGGAPAARMSQSRLRVSVSAHVCACLHVPFRLCTVSIIRTNGDTGAVVFVVSELMFYVVIQLLSAQCFVSFNPCVV